MALPITLLALGLTFALLRAPIERSWRAGWEWLRLGFVALAVGALWPTNTWDFPTYTLLVLAAFLLREWHASGRPTLAGVWRAGLRWLAVVALAYVLFLPFHRSFGGGYDGFRLWDGSRTSVGDYIIAHGFALFVIGAALLVDFLYGQGHNPIVRAMRLSGRVLFRPRRLRQMDRLYRAVVRPTPGYQIGMGAARAAVVLAVVLVALGMFLPGLLVGLLTLTVLLGWRSRIDPRWQMALVFVGVGLALSLFVEFVVLRGDISRMNTVFKFYLQVWVLFALAGAAAASLVWERIGTVPRGWRRAWRWGFVGLFAAVLLYPLIATPVRIGDRFATSPGQTLDGMAYMNEAGIIDGETRIAFAWDKDAIEWMERNVEGSPVIAEINTYPILYGWGNRYANYTGLPSIVGWDWHQRQQRAVVSGDMVTRRIEAVQELYNTTSAREAHDILRRYGATYVVVGALERAHAEPEGIAKFAGAPRGLWELAYSNEQVQIYRVLDGGAAAGGGR
jgi:YYY domain-containing protein